MTDKGFKTIDEQIAILSSRGLIIDNPEIAREFLLKNNYYRISGYSLTLRNHDIFYSNVHLQNIIDIYSFDHELRHILLSFIEQIEVNVKSVFSYEFAALYGALGYLNPANFTDASKHGKIIAKGNEQRDRRHDHEVYIKHFMDELKQELPLWAYVDLLTIHDISILYSIAEQRVKKAVAAKFDLNMNRNDEILGEFMHSLTIIRNLCAHGSRLYNRLFEQKPSLNKREKQLLMLNCDGTRDNAHLFGFILVMRRLLAENEFEKLKDAILKLSSRYPFVSLKYYGFPADWQLRLQHGQ